MDTLLTRYRNLTVLLVVVVAQLLYLAYQVKTNREDRLIRVWAVSAVTPFAGIVEALRRNTIGFMQDYFILLDVREQNRRLKADNDKLRMDNIYYRSQLATAEHARALILFQTQTQSKTVAARVVGNSTVATAKAVFIDRGSTSGLQKGMAVVTPDGIVGKVVAVYPLVAQVLLVTDATFKVGVESQRNHVHGVLNCGSGHCQVEQIQEEDKLDVGEAFFTSGEDRIFPKGFPVGTVTSIQPGQGMKDVKLDLSAAPGGAEEVLVLLQGVHQEIPTEPVVEETAVQKTLEAPPGEKGVAAEVAGKNDQVQTEADKIVQKYQAIGKDQGHVYGAIGSGMPNFNQKAAPAAGGATQAITGSSETKSTPQAAAMPQGQAQATVPAAKAPVAKPKPSPAVDVDLPLGAPRRKTVNRTDTRVVPNRRPAPPQNQQQPPQ